MRLRGHAAALRRTFAPLLRLRQIGFHALPHFVHDGDIVAGLQVALFRQLPPFGQCGGKIALFIRHQTCVLFIRTHYSVS